MGAKITLKASDGHELGGWRADPAGKPRGGIVVIQEIFGVNAHIRELCEGFAKDGYLAIAPSLYDRSSQKGVDLGYTPEDIAVGRKLREEFDWAKSMLDVDAAAAEMRKAGLKVGTVGYCWGGTISYLAGCRLDVQGAVVYYGGQIIPYVNEKERCPLLMHFGDKDQSIPLSDVEKIRQAHPNAEIHVYPADHGFNCDQRASYDAPSASLARQRTLEFLATYIG